MADKSSLKVYQRTDIERFTTIRDGETKVGESIKVLSDADPSHLLEGLKHAREANSRYAMLLVPEDIGPRANLGRAGANEAPAAFMNFFMNMQSNRFFNYSHVVMVGELEVGDLMLRSNGRDPDGLRLLCQELDLRLASVVAEIVKSGLEPIVIGGGNNNSLGTIRGVVNAVREETGKTDFGLSVCNCDPHADFRRMEGHHSGNPFTYASAQGFLKRYCVFGLHENYNSQDMLERLDTSGFRYFSYEDFAVTKKSSFEQSLELACAYMQQSGVPVGCELDMDSIIDMPSSAKTPFGISVEQAAQYVHTLASRCNTAYMHLSEGAPKWGGGDDGARAVGKALSILVVTYIKARESYHALHPAHGAAIRSTPPIGH